MSGYSVCPLYAILARFAPKPLVYSVARTSFIIAAIWWLYVQYLVHGGRGTWYW